MRAIHRTPTGFPVRAAILALALAVAPAVPALDEGPYSMEVLVNGSPLREHHARGTRYVEACEGCEYSVRLRNRTGRRIAVALAVDGLNSIDAKTTTAREASKWILGPHQTITIDGWQTSSETARRFFFTTEQDSYGAWLGRTSNLGVITAAVFREELPVQHPSPIAGEPSAPGKTKAGPRFEGRARESAPLSDDHAATGIGRELGHRVQRVPFRAEPTPAAVLQVRYEYHDALVRLGVLPWPHAQRRDPFERRESARGFEDMEFAPDPHR